jgi:hypothetical protein
VVGENAKCVGGTPIATVPQRREAGSENNGRDKYGVPRFKGGSQTESNREMSILSLDYPLRVHDEDHSGRAPTTQAVQLLPPADGACANQANPRRVCLAHRISTQANELGVHGTPYALAADIHAIPLLLGLGIDELSVDPTNIAMTKQIIKSLSRDKASKVTDMALHMEDRESIKNTVTEFLLQENIRLAVPHWEDD